MPMDKNGISTKVGIFAIRQIFQLVAVKIGGVGENGISIIYLLDKGIYTDDGHINLTFLSRDK